MEQFTPVRQKIVINQAVYLPTAEWLERQTGGRRAL
jgi:hypothetical protein